jgi:FOP N terminal dimerisation domain
MVDILSLKKDENFALKRDVLEDLSKQGYIDQMKAQLRARVIEAMEVRKKNSYGKASKYMKHSVIDNPITKKVVSHEDGLLCAEIMREFM